MTTVVAERQERAQASFGVEPHTADGELLLRVGKGDADAFEEIYRRFARPVLGLARRRLADAGSAEDATQETFVSIWRSASSFRPERGAGSAWLFTVARNSIVDRARKRIDTTVGEAPEQPSADADPSELAEQDWISWEVHSALERLPEREQEVLSLAYFSELSQTEIAAKLELPLGTVKTRTRSGLSRMATLLEGVNDRGQTGPA